MLALRGELTKITLMRITDIDTCINDEWDDNLMVSFGVDNGLLSGPEISFDILRGKMCAISYADSLFPCTQSELKSTLSLMFKSIKEELNLTEIEIEFLLNAFLSEKIEKNLDDDWLYSMGEMGEIELSKDDIGDLDSFKGRLIIGVTPYKKSDVIYDDELKSFIIDDFNEEEWLHAEREMAAINGFKPEKITA